MPNMETTEPGARKVLPIIYVLDTSGSMEGNPIGALNQAMNETIPILREVESENASAEIKIGALAFSSGVRWISNGLEYIDDFIWNDVKAGGLTELGAALNELNSKMSRSEIFQSDTGFKLPVLLFMSDGVPTDDWEAALDAANIQNKWFLNSTKIAIALGQKADRSVLTKVVDNNPEAVILVNNLETLKTLIKVMSATASKIGSVSKVNTGTSMATQIVENTRKQMGGDTGDAGVQNPAPPVPTPAATGKSQSGWDDDDWN